MKPIAVTALAVALSLGCNTKKFPLLSKNDDNNNPNTSSSTPTSSTTTPPPEQATDPVLVTGVYLACSPIAGSTADTSAVGCVVADSHNKQKLDLNMVMQHWTFGVDKGTVDPSGGVTSQLDQSDAQYHFKLSVSGGTPDGRDAALKDAKVSLAYSTKNNASSQVDYALADAGSMGDLKTPIQDASSKMGPITGTLLKMPLTMSQSAQTGLMISQQVPADAQNIQLTMRGWPQPTADQPIKASVYFGVTALVVNTLELGFDLSFDHGSQHCASVISFAAGDTGSASSFDCH